MKTLKKAFTLAEVMAVLTILGIVASLTIANVARNSQQREFVTKYKKTVAALDNAFMSFQAENSFVLNPPKVSYSYWKEPNWRGHGGFEVLANEFICKYISCEISGRLGANNNIFNTYNNGGGITLLNGTKPAETLNRHGKIILRDGTEISMSAGHEHWVRHNGNSVFNSTMIIDVNGEAKGPNVIGRDIFLGWLLFDGYHANPLPVSEYDVGGGVFGYMRTAAMSNEPCSKNTSGVTCARWFLNHAGYEH